MEIKLRKIAVVKNTRSAIIDDHWADIISEIELEPWVPTEAFENIDKFSQLEIIYYFDQIENNDIVFSGRPRGNAAFPIMGIFAQRKKDRPNKIGLSRVTLLEQQERKIFVKGLDAINGSPVIDIKPVFREFQQNTEIIQPAWVEDLMKNYW